MFAEKNWLSALPRELAMCRFVRGQVSRGGVLSGALVQKKSSIVGTATAKGTYHRLTLKTSNKGITTAK